jgi:hypothetical protein
VLSIRGQHDKKKGVNNCTKGIFSLESWELSATVFIFFLWVSFAVRAAAQWL